MKNNQFDARPTQSRRRILKAGAFVVPTIVTLHAAPAWATTDYTQIAYTYGINKGKCRNPNFDPNSNASWKREQFMPCDQIKRQGSTRLYHEAESEGSSSSSSSDVIQF